jgi:hypothetical protein
LVGSRSLSSNVPERLLIAGIAFEAAFGAALLMCDASSRALLLLGSLPWLPLSRSPGVLVVAVAARVDLVAVGGVDVEADAVSLRAFVADRSSLVPAVFFPRVSIVGGRRVQRVEKAKGGSLHASKIQ